MKRIALLYGGTSREREVSLKSGRAVHEALKAIGHKTEAFDLTQDSLSSTGINAAHFDFAFIAMHGGWGENGGVQAELDALGIPYSGSDAISCHLAMDKDLSKASFFAARVPTALCRVVHDGADIERELRRAARALGWPLVVKPACEGSSIGVSVAKDMDELIGAAKEALSYGPRALIERFVKGRELTVAIIGARAYPVVEVQTGHGFFDFNAKYVDKSTRYVPNPDLPGPAIKKAQHYAKRAYDALRCHGYGRVDLILGDDGEFCLLEVNTAPGMTARSLVPMATGAAGMSFEETVQCIIDASLAPRRKISAHAGESRRARQSA